MNNISAQGTLNGLTAQSRIVVFAAILLFALSGLISGFAVGAFVNPKLPLASSRSTGTAPIVQKNPAQTPISTEHPIPLGFPVIDQATNAELADGTTTYTFSAHAVDQSIDKGHGKAVHMPGITCRLWLIPITQDPLSIPLDRLKSPETLQTSPLPGEIPGMNFDPTTPQTQTSKADGEAMWKYQLNPSVGSGSYFLMVLTDWQGTHYNWSWIRVTVKNLGQ